jgi:long-chain acyl-CoA synthetase
MKSSLGSADLAVFGDRPALLTATEAHTFLELRSNAKNLASGLFRRGVRPGDRLALFCGNRAEYVETNLAAELLGVSAIAFSRDLLGIARANALALSNARAVVLDETFPELEKIGLATTDCAVRLSIGREMAGFEPFDAAHSKESEVSVVSSDAARMVLTSGTTGGPKLVHHAPQRANLLALALLRKVAFKPGIDRALAPLPLYRTGVYNLSVNIPIKCGVGVVLMNTADATQLDPEELLQLIERHRITYAYLSPYLFHRLLELPEPTRRKYNTSSLRAVVHGGSPCPVAVKRAMIDWLGPVLIEYYAGSEGGAVVIDSREWLRRPGSVGRPQPAGQVRILDDGDHDAEPGTCGKIYFRAPHAGRFSYHDAPRATAGAYLGDWFTLGDLGYLDEEGFLFLTGRSDEAIIVLGVNIHPAEIESVLTAHPAVAHAVALGLPRPDRGEVVGAVVVLREGFAGEGEVLASLHMLARERLGPFKSPAAIVFAAEIPGLETGKIQRSSLRSLFAGQMQ